MSSETHQHLGVREDEDSVKQTMEWPVRLKENHKEVMFQKPREESTSGRLE